MSDSGFLEELKRRGVVRVAVVYAAAAFAVLEFSDIAFPRLGLPDSAVDWVLALGLLGLPVSLGLAWVFEVKRDPGNLAARRPASWLSPVALVAAVVLVGVGVATGWLWGRTEAAPAPSSAYESQGSAFDSQGSAIEAQAPRPVRSIAVIPFANITGEEETEPFTIGIHDDILTHLSRIKDLRVISRTSVLSYRDTTKKMREIGEELNVATVLEGGVQRAGGMLRVNVQLIDTRTDDHLFAKSFDKKWNAENIFSIQSEIAISVAEALQASLTAQERKRISSVPTQNIAALETYFLGKQLLEARNVPSLLAATEYFKKVIQLDPSFALAHSGLADAYMLLPEYSATVDRKMIRSESEAAARRAFDLDPEIPEVLTSMGWTRLIHDYDWAGAESLLRRALSIEANNTNALHWLSHVLSWQGRHKEAIALAQQALEVDPRSATMHTNLSYMYMDAGDFPASLRRGEEVRKQFPEYTSLLRNLFFADLRAGDAERATTTLVEWAAATGNDVAAYQELGDHLIRYAATGVPSPIPPELVERLALGSNFMASFHAYVGDKESALSSLETAYTERSGSRSLLSMKVEPGFDFLRGEVRFERLIDQVGL